MLLFCIYIFFYFILFIVNITGIQLLEVLSTDTFQRFVIAGFGGEALVTIRHFRGE